jgi:hypothetical protein
MNTSIEGVLAVTNSSKDLAQELEQARSNGCVGQVLVSETDRVRVWSISLAPGERLGFHRHVLDYFHTAVTDGRSSSLHADGAVIETVYRAGDTQQLSFGLGQDMIHDLTNTGTSDLLFTTVEFLDSPNPPLPLPDSCPRQ